MSFIKANGLFVICLCVFILAAKSCSLFDHDRDIIANKEDLYSGIYTQGIEDSWFEPCISMDESWKPLFTDSTFKPVTEAQMGNISNKVFIRARGIPSKKGEYMGWFALYDREFEIKEIIKAESSKSGKCP